MVSRRTVPGVRMAGLKQAARLAGESFGHEDDVLAVPRDRLSSRVLWAVSALIAIGGLAMVALRFS